MIKPEHRGGLRPGQRQYGTGGSWCAMSVIGCVWIGSLAGVSVARAQQLVNYTGTYQSTGPAGTVTLALGQADRQVDGKMTDVNGAVMGIAGEVASDGQFHGVAVREGDRIRVAAMFKSDTLVWLFLINDQPQQLQFTRVGQDAVPARKEMHLSRHVSINRKRLDDQTLRILEVGMGIQIPDGTYWYDSRCGAVGRWGGPALAFFPANLNIGGPLTFDASGGASNVVINGRALHIYDIAGLCAIVGPVMPGRYWLDAQGNFGVEGGPPMGNLLAIGRMRAAAAQGASQAHGGSDAWTRYTDYGGSNGRTHMGSFGNGDFYFSGGDVSWWPGK